LCHVHLWWSLSHKQFTAFNLFYLHFKFLHPALAPLSLLTPFSKAALQRLMTKVACKMNMALCEAAKGWEKNVTRIWTLWRMFRLYLLTTDCDKAPTSKVNFMGFKPVALVDGA
jgi:hypothetical protein